MKKGKSKKNEGLLLKVQQHTEEAEVWNIFSASVFTRNIFLQESQGANMENGRYTFGGRGSLQAVLRENGWGPWCYAHMTEGTGRYHYETTLNNLWLIIEIRRSKCHSCLREVQGGEPKELQISWPQLNPWGSYGAGNNGNHMKTKKIFRVTQHVFPKEEVMLDQLDNLLWQNYLPGRWGDSSGYCLPRLQ